MLTYLDWLETESGEADGWIVMLNRRSPSCVVFTAVIKCMFVLVTSSSERLPGYSSPLRLTSPLPSVLCSLLLFTSVSRFCKDVFDKNYKATIGVDFEMERFEVLGVPFSLQLWVWLEGRPRSTRGGQSSLNLGCCLSVAQMGHGRTGEVQMHRFHVLQRRSGWGTQQWPAETLIKTLVSGFSFSFSCHHHVWCQWYSLFFPCEVSVSTWIRLVCHPPVCVKLPRFCLQAVAGGLAEGERPHSCPAVPRGHKERPERASR